MQIDVIEQNATISSRFVLSPTLTIRNREKELVEFLRWVAKNRITNLYGNKGYTVVGSIQFHHDKVKVLSKVDKKYAEELAEWAESYQEELKGMTLFFNGLRDVVGMTPTSNLNGTALNDNDKVYTVDQMKVALKDTVIDVMSPAVAMNINKNLATFTESVLDDVIHAVEVHGRIFRFNDSIIPYLIMMQFPFYNAQQLYLLADQFRGKAGETMFWYYTYQYFGDTLFKILDERDYQMTELVFIHEVYNLMEELQNDDD